MPRPRLPAKFPAVLALVVLAIGARADRLPPAGVLLVPRDGLLESLVEGHLRQPAELADLLAGERVAAVVPEPVGDVLDEVLRLAGELDDPLDDLEVRGLVRPPGV